MARPKVSVLLPVYNTREEYLRETIESLLAQTMADFELLILNDCSTDPRVEQLALSYKDARIRYFRNEKNLGISLSRNRLIEAAAGEYLAVADHDDLSRPDRLARQSAYLDAHPEVGVVGAWARFFPWRRKTWKMPLENGAIEEVLTYACAVIHPTAMIRRSVLIQNNLRYEERYSPAEDYALWCRLIGKTKFANLPEILLDYRRHSTSTTRLQREKMNRATRWIHVFVRADHPELWDAVQAGHPLQTTIRLFGFLPLLTVRKRMDRSTWFLFGFIPLLRIKTKFINS